MTRCFLDIDGVLADFTKGVFNHFNMPYTPSQIIKYWWFQDFGFSNDEIDAISTCDFFAGLQWTPDGKQILALLEGKFDQENIYLISAVMPNPQSFAGRMMWIERYIPFYKDRTWLGRVPKSLLVGNNCLLVDDCDENIDGFVAAGGSGILVPRPWNELAGWADRTLEVVRNSLEAL